MARLLTRTDRAVWKKAWPRCQVEGVSHQAVAEPAWPYHLGYFGARLGGLATEVDPSHVVLVQGQKLVKLLVALEIVAATQAELRLALLGCCWWPYAVQGPFIRCQRWILFSGEIDSDPQLCHNGNGTDPSESDLQGPPRFAGAFSMCGMSP
jgi:hypothetical protein